MLAATSARIASRSSSVGAAWASCYWATDLRLGRPVALKLLSPELSGDARFRARFERESHLAAALDAAHARGLIHRDVKPSNALVAREDVYLADFGLNQDERLRFGHRERAGDRDGRLHGAGGDPG